VQPPSRGLAMGTEPGAHQHLEHGVPHVGQADGTDSAQLVVGEIRFKIVFHKGLLGEQKFSYRNILPHFPVCHLGCNVVFSADAAGTAAFSASLPAVWPHDRILKKYWNLL
jgi:hypothetical protein